MSRIVDNDEVTRTAGGILIPSIRSTTPQADQFPDHIRESLRVMARDYGTAPPETPAPQREAYEAIVAAILSVERLRHELVIPSRTTHQRLAEVGELIAIANDRYRGAESHLRTETGGSAFAEAMHSLDNIARMLTDPTWLASYQMFREWPGATESTNTLNALRDQIAAQNMPHRRVGVNYIIQGRTLTLTEMLADLLEMSLRPGGTPRREVYAKIKIDEESPSAANELTARIDKLKKRLNSELARVLAPYLINVRMEKPKSGPKIPHLIATIVVPKILPGR